MKTDIDEIIDEWDPVVPGPWGLPAGHVPLWTRTVLAGMDHDDHWALLGAGVYGLWAVGSRTIEGAWTDESDYDFLVYRPDTSLARHLSIPLAPGFVLDDEGKHYEPSEGVFNSWRKGRINLIMSRDWDFCRKFLHANLVAQSEKITCRDGRVKLFSHFLYGESMCGTPGELNVKGNNG